MAPEWSAFGEVMPAPIIEESGGPHSAAVEPIGMASSVAAEHARHLQVVAVPVLASSTSSAAADSHKDPHQTLYPSTRGHPPPTSLSVAVARLSGECRSNVAEATASGAAVVRSCAAPITVTDALVGAHRLERAEEAELAVGAPDIVAGSGTTTERAADDEGVNHVATAVNGASVPGTPPRAGTSATCAEPDSPLMFGSMPILSGRPPTFTEWCAYQDGLAPGRRYRSVDNSPSSSPSRSSPSGGEFHL